VSDDVGNKSLSEWLGEKIEEDGISLFIPPRGLAAIVSSTFSPFPAIADYTGLVTEVMPCSALRVVSEPNVRAAR
jgi:hypothetical protein